MGWIQPSRLQGTFFGLLVKSAVDILVFAVAHRFLLLCQSKTNNAMVTKTVSIVSVDTSV